MDENTIQTAQIISIIPREELYSQIESAIEKAVKRALTEKEPPKYYSIREAAMRTGKALSTLYTDHSRGRLKGFKSGRHLRFTEEQLQAYLEGR